MGHARHPLSLLALVAVLGAAAGGCGSSSDGGSTGSTLDAKGAAHSTAPAGATVRTCRAVAEFGEVRVSGLACAPARRIAASWSGAERCRSPRGASRTSCSIEGYRCLGTATERGLAVSCAAPSRSLSFVAEP